MIKCKFCENQRMMTCKIFGYKKFSFCGECLNWVLIETSNMQDTDLRLEAGE